MTAKTLKEAFNALNPRQKITPDRVDELFVSRHHSPVEDMQIQLEMTDTPLKLLFIGHRGAGKSSEMAYLSTLLEDDYLTIFVELYDVFKNRAVSHTEVIFAVMLRLLATATDESLIPHGVVSKTWDNLLESIYKPLRTYLFGPEEIPADKEASITLKLNVLVGELELKIGSESYTRSQVKEKFEGRMADLLEQVGHLSRLLEEALGRKLLLIVEDLDKLDLAVVRDLFQDHAQTLTSPHPSMIYSFPVEMRYDNAYKQIERGFDEAHMLPNASLTHRDGTVDAEGRKTMWNILLKRVDTALFADGVLDSAITWSGGHVKTLIQLVQQAVVKTVREKADTVQKEHLVEAKNKLRNDYVVGLKHEQLLLLQQLHNDAKKNLSDTTAAKQVLLGDGSLLEYDNTIGPWADVNPIVVELFDLLLDN